MKKRKSYDRDFNPFETRTICYIHLDNIEIPVQIIRDKNVVKLHFVFNNKTFYSKEIKIVNQSDMISNDLSRIHFYEKEIHDIDKRNLAKCIDKIF